MVSRETSIASGLDQMGLSAGSDVASRLDRLTQILLDEAIPKGFLGPNEATDIVGRHIMDCAATAVLIGEDDGGVIDVGSGAGLPCLVLACLGSQVVAVESLGRRADFIERVALDLALDVRVVRSRAEDAGRTVLRQSANAVVARALAEPPVALELTLPFARVGGRVILPASDTYAAEIEIRDGEARLTGLRVAAHELGGGPPVVRGLSIPVPMPSSDSGATRPGWFIMVEKVSDTVDRYPRRPGVPKRRPLG